MERLKRGILIRGRVFCVITFAFLFVSYFQSYSQNTPFSLHAVSDLKRVFEDGYNLPPISDTIQLFGIRGEVLSGQCVINAMANLSEVTVELGPFRDNEVGASLPLNSAEWNFVGSIPLSTNAPNQPEYALVRKAPAMYPDYLMAERQLGIPQGTYQPIWLTLSIPENAAAGSYNGTVTVISRQEKQSIPLQVTVYPLTLPEKRNLKIAEWYSTRGFERFHGIDEMYSKEWFAMLRKYADNMVAHRQNVFQVPASSIEINKSTAGTFQFDFTRFDQIAEVFWSTGKMDFLETGDLARFGEEGFSSTEIKFKDFSVMDANNNRITMPGDKVVPYLLPAFERHLREKGWLEKTLFHIKDEPSHHNALDWIKVSKTIHQYAPDLKRIDALTTSFVLDDIEVAVPKLDAFDAGYEVFRKWQKEDAKNELWFYTVGIFQGSIYPNKTIDMPVIHNRILHWLNYKYDATGYLHWGWNQWTEDPFHEIGKHLGDGWHVYPTKDGVLNSLRWEQMRNGIQDYECFRMLEDKVRALKDSLGSHFSWIDPTQRGKEIVSQVASNLVRHSTEPQVLYKAKKELINELLEFEASPMIYIQTNPLEHGKIINRSVVELLGWVEPGSIVAVNLENLPVADDGLMMGRYIIYTGGKLEIVVTKDNKTKKIIRDFNVTY